LKLNSIIPFSVHQVIEWQWLVRRSLILERCMFTLKDTFHWVSTNWYSVRKLISLGSIVTYIVWHLSNASVTITIIPEKQLPFLPLTSHRCYRGGVKGGEWRWGFGWVHFLVGYVWLLCYLVKILHPATGRVNLPPDEILYKYMFNL